MPNYHDFSKLNEIKKIPVRPKGWIQPLYVEYEIGDHGSLPSYFWRVLGTKHTFIIPIVRLNFLSSGNYVKHFEEILEGFREDYLEWEEGGFQAPWMQEYRGEFERFIYKDKGS